VSSGWSRIACSAPSSLKHPKFETVTWNFRTEHFQGPIGVNCAGYLQSATATAGRAVNRSRSYSGGNGCNALGTARA